MKQRLIARFYELFGEGGEVRCFFAPGRVNLIGEHTDYNGGHVFPCALTIGTYAVVRLRDDRRMRFFSENLSQHGIIEGSLDELTYKKEANWTNYPMGVIWTYGLRGYQVDRGLDILVSGTIPEASGLSSSASVEVLTGVILNGMFGFGVSMVDVALYGQYTENKFIGVNCGIMDQFAIAMGREGKAIFLDTSDLSYVYAPVDLNGAKLVIGNTNKKRGLGDSKYNERRAECEKALAELQSVVNIRSLGELDEETFEKYRSAIQSETRQRRAKHAVYENRRTVKAVEALNTGDVAGFGKLMDASHISLRDDYEVTGRELDTMVESAWKQDGVIGARMTGAGFGGCTVSIVKDECVDAFIKNVGSEYEKEIGYPASFYVVEIGGCGREI